MRLIESRNGIIRPEFPQNEPNAVQGGCRSAPAKEGGKFCCHAGDKALEAEDVEDAGEIVTERHQAPFAAHLVEAAEEEVPVSGAAFDRAEGMLDDRRSTTHQFTSALHPCAVTFEDIFMLPAVDDPLICIWRETASPQPARVADRLAAEITVLDPAAQVLPALLGPMQQLTGGTTVGIGCGLIAEVLAAEATLFL